MFTSYSIPKIGSLQIIATANSEFTMAVAIVIYKGLIPVIYKMPTIQESGHSAITSSTLGTKPIQISLFSP